MAIAPPETTPPETPSDRVPLREAENLGEAFRERVLRTEDAQEGPLAFVEKREPNWKAR